MRMQTSIEPRVQNRVRAFHTKSADGCKTCRIRRIKCDKQKPACKRCTKTGRTCDGYSPSPPGATPSSSPSVPPFTESHPPPILTPTISTAILGDPQERRSFSFFYRHTAPQLSGAFDSSEFWHRLLLQATHHEPAIRHAAVALGALHESFETTPTLKSNEKESHDLFALQQYSKAIKSLLVQGKQAADVALVTCVLFIYFEILRGHHASAISHINSGIKILSELHSSSYVPLPTLTLLFIRFDAQASALLADRKLHLLSHTLSTSPSGYQSSIPEKFGSLEEARNALDFIRMEAFKGMESVDKRDPVTLRVRLELVRSVAVIRLKQWNEALEAFVGMGKGDRDAVNVLKMQKIMMDFQLGMDNERVLVDECVWDEYTAEFNNIIQLAEEILGVEDGRGKWEGVGSGRRVLCDGGGGAGIVPPLYFVATKCRVSGVRWRAIELMRRVERQEGLWNSVLTAGVAERLVWMEEEGMVDGVVKRGNRVKGVEVMLDVGERRARLRFRRQKNGEKREEMEVIGDWIAW